MSRQLVCLVLLALGGTATAQPDPCAPGPGLPPDEPPVQPHVAPAPQPPPPPPQPPPPPPRQPSNKELDARASYEPSSIALGGFVQPRLRLREGKPEPNMPPRDDSNGFALPRARVTALGQTRSGNLDLSAYFEYDLGDGLFDAYATVGRRLPERGRIEVDAGMMRVPLSRQQMLHDKRLAFVDKAQLAGLLPDRDLGVRVNLAVPGMKVVRVLAGIFNGDGRRTLQNSTDNKFLYAARVEVSPFGRDRPLGESMFGGGFVTLGASVGKNTTIEQLRQQILGLDLALAIGGVSASVEYLEKHSESRDGTSFVADHSGWALQGSYLLPVRLPPHRQARLELGVRYEELDLGMLSVIAANRATTAALSYYLRGHALKGQLAYTSFEEQDVAQARDNNQLLFQLQYAIE